MNWHFIEPVDVLFLRGNKLFGDPGSYGESQIPPWPSAVAGAIRASLLARDSIDLQRFARGEERHPAIGTPAQPGPFRVTGFGLARRVEERVERIWPLPADLVLQQAGERLAMRRISPRSVAAGIASSFPLARLPVLTQPDRAKPASGYWLRDGGWKRYLAGETPSTEDLIATDKLWRADERVGVGLDPVQRRADDGKLFSLQGADFCKDVGFAVAVDGADLPAEDLLRFGGDGRGARLLSAEYQPPQVSLDNLAAAGRARIVLTTPGLFPDGWRLPGMREDGRFELMGVHGRVVAAAVSRAEVVSGWDLARWQPKTARRAAPIGSVYWIEDLQATPEQLGKLADHGLWPAEGYDAQRRAEGFNRFEWGAW
ncbi:MAG TPA: type III-B CRISPR module-associated protein Cmr3 [Thermopetrobacter sp.]|nr:type III-B CRISPR module-associated protein Cmr3 [Thermopetrobacter sp.]